MLHKEILDRMSVARAEIADAEGALAAVMTELQHRKRAEKVTVGSRIGESLERLEAARTELIALERILADEPSDGSG